MCTLNGHYGDVFIRRPRVGELIWKNGGLSLPASFRRVLRLRDCVGFPGAATRRPQFGWVHRLGREGLACENVGQTSIYIKISKRKCFEFGYLELFAFLDYMTTFGTSGVVPWDLRVRQKVIKNIFFPYNKYGLGTDFYNLHELCTFSDCKSTP